MRRWIVVALEQACTVVDRLWAWPAPFRWIPALLGCPHGFGLWSALLDERWHTGVWEDHR